MHRFFSFILLYICCISTFAQITIPLQKENGVYKLSCEVNGARMKMILDTGASYVSLSMSMARYLYENDYITDDDIKGKGTSRIATGEIVDNIKVNLREVKIGSLKVKDIDAIILENQDAPLLFGLSAIKALGTVTINGDNLIINNAEIELDKEVMDFLCDAMRDEAIEFHDEEKYHAAADVFQRIRNTCGLEADDYAYLIECLYRIGEYEKALTLTTEWENSEEFRFTNDEVSSDIYRFATLAASDNKNYSKEIELLKKHIVVDERLGWNNSLSYFRLGLIYDKNNYLPKAKIYYRKAIYSLLKDGKVSLEEAINRRPKIAEIKRYGVLVIKEDFYEDLGSFLHTYAYVICAENNYRDTPASLFLIKCAAKCGDNDAIEDCKDRNISYQNILYDSKFDYLFD